VFGIIEPMRLLTAGKWRFVKTVKHSVWPASVSLMSVLSSKVASGGAIAISIVSKLECVFSYRNDVHARFHKRDMLAVFAINRLSVIAPPAAPKLGGKSSSG
jgi:hypothetical protein